MEDKSNIKEVPKEIKAAIDYLDEYDLYTPYQEAWQKVKEHFQINTDH